MRLPRHRSTIRTVLAVVALALVGSTTACGSSDDGDEASNSAITSTTITSTTTASSTITSTTVPAEEPAETSTADGTEPAATSSFSIDVWADNWAAVYVDGELVGEDSVPITTERSFNSETFTFEAAYPFTIAIEAKDFKETDSGIEYIGEPNQQMGDGGLIAQVTDTATGEVVATTTSGWGALVVQEAPLNTECVDDPDPDATCEFNSIDPPAGWTDADFDDGAWAVATEWSSQEVSPKDGYDEITWAEDARFVWGSDLEVDNTVLLRFTVEAG